MNTAEVYRATKWLDVAAETYALEQAYTRFQVLIEEEGYTDDQKTPSRRLRKAAVTFLEAEKTFCTLKERASL